ncbi:MAG TPA: Fe-S cluster assembly protein SufB [Aggregatilinea sp.]|uniref:Fe-S cluster assembly protein SufB n=1 Tax=Aggregatilinea sp. TaxID=2806333 RepID=UPI002B9B913E|nr:Fe-S cluster assembly protein SufB [Aggregatilinea sp.]HML23038.1 Fe-S cluster assembly protein SufB [Aggregatilinea sp.]
MTLSDQEQIKGIREAYEEEYGFSDPDSYVFKTRKGLDANVVAQISEAKNEPQWMRDYRLNALKIYQSKPVPTWGPDLSGLREEDIYYYVRPADKEGRTWDEVPENIKKTFDRLGIPEAEQKFLAGAGAQYDSEMVYHRIREELEAQGVIFKSIDVALQENEDLFKEYFGTVIPAHDNKYAALNSAVWSGGSFIYVPPGVKIEMPLQAYFRLNTASIGQFERTIIIVDEGAFLHYVEGCTAPAYTTESLHSGVIEIVVKRGARSRYTTIQNWSDNVYNLVTQRAMVYGDASHEWVDANLGSKITMKYPSLYLMEPGAHGEILSIAFAGKGQIQDAGGKAVHVAPHTTSQIISKSICKDGGRSSYRGLLKVHPNAEDSKSTVVCDALLLDDHSESDTYPYIEIESPRVTVGHEATVSKVGDDQIFYLMSRGMTEDDANAMVVNGFLEPLTKELPMEYSIEMNRLIRLQMEGSIG